MVNWALLESCIQELTKVFCYCSWNKQNYKPLTDKTGQDTQILAHHSYKTQVLLVQKKVYYKIWGILYEITQTMWVVFSELGILVAKIHKITLLEGIHIYIYTYIHTHSMYIYIYRRVARCLQQVIIDYNTDTLYILTWMWVNVSYTYWPQYSNLQGQQLISVENNKLFIIFSNSH